MRNQTNPAEALVVTKTAKSDRGRSRRMARPPEGGAKGSAQTDASSDTSPAPAATTRPNKTIAVIALLTRPDGATLAELIAATGWLPHTTRGCCQSNANRSLHDGAAARPCVSYPISDCHSASAAERRSL
jgi:hypothetical protein